MKHFYVKCCVRGLEWFPIDAKTVTVERQLLFGLIRYDVKHLKRKPQKGPCENEICQVVEVFSDSEGIKYELRRYEGCYFDSKNFIRFLWLY